MTTTRGQNLIGKTIGSCILESLIGYGGSSAVFLANSLDTQERVAVKVFLPRSTLDGPMRKSFYRRFLREAEAASKLDHPNILSIYSYGEHEGLPYIVMPYMPGGTLAEYVQQHSLLTLDEVESYLKQIAAALDYAHEHGCVHCDVKPANILLDGTGRATLSDFGIVHLTQNEEAMAASNKSTDKSGEILMGTPDYVSPEQALGETLDGRSDVYSLGATLYYLLTGRPPFKAETPIALALMHIHEAPVPPGVLRADITPQIDFVLAKALSKWPEERFQTAGTFSVAFAMATREASEAPQFSLKHARAANASVDQKDTAASEPPAAPPIIHVKRMSPRRFAHSRLSLMSGLMTLVLLICLTVTLLIGVITTVHAQPPKVRAIPTIHPTSTDVLSQQPQDWQTSSTFFFQNGSYHIQNKSQGNLAIAFYASYQFENFQLSVTTREVAGTLNSVDYYGVLFRTSADQSHYYLFEVMSWDKGQYGFLRYNGGQWDSLAFGVLPGFLTNMGDQNVVSIKASGNKFSFTVNGNSVGNPIVDRSTRALTSGGIGLIVEEPDTEIAFSHLSIGSL